MKDFLREGNTLSKSLNGFIKLHRQIMEWGWYQDSVVKSVFLHLLLTANFKETQWMGVTLKSGQVVIGTQRLADELGFSRQQIRTALKKLRSTGEITTAATNKYTIVTVTKWADYQFSDETATNGSTDRQPTNDRRTTDKPPQRKNGKNDKNDKNGKKEHNSDASYDINLFIAKAFENPLERIEKEGGF